MDLFKDNQAFQDHESRFAYDSLGRLAFGLEPNGDRTAVAYNTNHQPRRVDLYPGGTSPPRSTWMTYDRMGHLAWTIDGAGNQQIMAHHEKRQRSVEASIIAENVTPEGVTPGVRGPTVSTVSTFDLQGMPLTTEQFGSKETATSPWLAKTWQYDYNAAGDLLGQTRPDSNLSTASYNLVGWPLDLTDQSDVGTLMSAMTQKDYNAYGQVTKLTEPGTPAAITTYSYNGFGELTERLLPRGQRETMTYDTYGRLERHKTFKNTSQLVEDLQWTYASSTAAHTENLKWMNSPSGQADLASFKYDPYGRLTNTQSFGIRQVSLAGQSGGAKRVDTGYAYDGAGRLTSMNHEMSQGGNAMWAQAVSYAYSANAGKWSMTTSHSTSAMTLTQTDDALGRPGSLSMLGTGNDGWASAITFGWAGDLYTGRSQVYQTGPAAGSFDPDPIQESRRFDGFGRLRKLAYNAVKLSPSTGEPLESAWGQAYCLKAWEALCAEPLASSDFKWNTMDQLVSFDQKLRQPMWADGSQTALMPEEDRRQQWRGYAYSKRGYLTREYDSGSWQTGTHQGFANHSVTAGQVETVRLQSGGQIRRWNWEREAGAGDLTRIVEEGNTAAERWRHVGVGGSNARKLGHELVSVSVQGEAAQPITHDGRGRISQDTHFEYAWDGADRLVGAKRKGHNVWEEVHHYDAQGRLVYTERGQTAERFVHDGDQKVAMLDETGALVWQAAWGPGLDELICWRDVQEGQGYIALGDGQKSVVGLWHQRSASLSHARSFDALGRATLWNPDESAGCEELAADEVCDWQPSQARFGFGWHSAWRSPLTGLVQMRQRWYSPALGQFLSPDPLEYVDSHNLWAFVGQDPVNGWDPFGLDGGGFIEAIKRDLRGREQFLDESIAACRRSPGLGCLTPALNGLSYVVTTAQAVQGGYNEARQGGDGKLVALAKGARRMSDPAAGVREAAKAHKACQAGDDVACAQRNNAVGAEVAGALGGAKAKMQTRRTPGPGANPGASSKAGSRSRKTTTRCVDCFPRATLRGVSLKWLKKNKPRGWTKVAAGKYVNGKFKRTKGWVWLDQNGVERLRFMRPLKKSDPKFKWGREENGYFRWRDKDGNHLDVDGNIVPESAPDFQPRTHIPYNGLN